jgi:nucleobase:cation symporter-1, NCS1 family
VHKKLNIHELYNGHGIYRYTKVGINWRAYASFFVAIAPLLPGFSKSINNKLDVGGAWKIYTFSCMYGFVISGLVYYIICKYVSDVGAAMIDEAVYPPQKFDARDVEVGVPAPEEEDSVDEKRGVAVAVGQKEIEEK